MEQLFKEGMLRLSGKSDQAVFELTQAMGGGKTHMMVALGLLAHLRPEVLSAELNVRIDFGTARIAAFNGRNSPDNYIWGEIATLLGAAEAIKPFWVNGPRTVDQRHPSSRSPASPLTVPSTPVSVTKQLRLAAQPPSYRLVKTQSRGSPTRRGRSHETKLCAHQNASVGPSGDDGAATTAEAASKPRCIV